MSYVDLPDHVNCSHLGRNSPVILRAEAGAETGGMVIEEYRSTVPHVHLYGETGAAREQFAAALHSFRDYLDSLSQDATIKAGQATVSPKWFQIELRTSEYRANLSGDEKSYSLSWVIAEGVVVVRLQRDLEAAYARLKSVYERFFDRALYVSESTDRL